jgi:hypothetical protein
LKITNLNLRQHIKLILLFQLFAAFLYPAFSKASGKEGLGGDSDAIRMNSKTKVNSLSPYGREGFLESVADQGTVNQTGSTNEIPSNAVNESIAAAEIQNAITASSNNPESAFKVYNLAENYTKATGTVLSIEGINFLKASENDPDPIGLVLLNQGKKALEASKNFEDLQKKIQTQNPNKRFVGVEVSKSFSSFSPLMKKEIQDLKLNNDGGFQDFLNGYKNGGDEFLLNFFSESKREKIKNLLEAAEGLGDQDKVTKESKGEKSGAFAALRKKLQAQLNAITLDSKDEKVEIAAEENTNPTSKKAIQPIAREVASVQKSGEEIFRPKTLEGEGMNLQGLESDKDLERAFRLASNEEEEESSIFEIVRMKYRELRERNKF